MKYAQNESISIKDGNRLPYCDGSAAKSIFCFSWPGQGQLVRPFGLARPMSYLSNIYWPGPANAIFID